MNGRLKSGKVIQCNKKESTIDACSMNKSQLLLVSKSCQNKNLILYDFMYKTEMTNGTEYRLVVVEVEIGARTDYKGSAQGGFWCEETVLCLGNVGRYITVKMHKMVNQKD